MTDLIDGRQSDPLHSERTRFHAGPGPGPTGPNRGDRHSSRVGRGQTVFREGDLDPILYIVESGGVAIEVTVPGRGRVIILTVGPGEVFGWSSMFQQRPKTASARASSPTRALALDADRLRELCDTDPKLGYVLTRRLLEVVSERLKATRMQLLDIYGS